MIFGKTVLLLSKSVKLTRVILLIALGALLASCGNSGTSSGVENLRAPGGVPRDLVSVDGDRMEICYVVDKAPALFYSVMEGSSHYVDLQVTVYSEPSYALENDGRSVQFGYTTCTDNDSFCADDDRNESLGPLKGCKYETSAGSHPITKGRHLLAGYKANGPEATRVKSGAYAADYEGSMADCSGVMSDYVALGSATTYPITNRKGQSVSWSHATLIATNVKLFDTLEDPDLEEGREIVKYKTMFTVNTSFPSNRPNSCGGRYNQVCMCGKAVLPTGMVNSLGPMHYGTETFVWIDDYVDKTIGQDQPCAKDSYGACL